MSDHDAAKRSIFQYPNAVKLGLTGKQYANFIRRIYEKGACWEWLGCYSEEGYGRIMFNGVRWRAPRLAFLLAGGDIPDGLLVCHTCDNPKCVFPVHLFLGTHQDNVSDCIAKNRRGDLSKWQFKKGVANPSSILTADRVLEMRAIRQHDGLSFLAIGKLFGVSKATARKAITGDSWK